MTVTEFPAPIAQLTGFRVFQAAATDGRTFLVIAMRLANPETGEPMILDVAMTDDQARQLSGQLSEHASDIPPDNS